MNGNLVGGTFNIPTRSAANGVWSVNEVAAYTRQQMWPTANDPSWSSVQFLMHGDAVLNTGNPIDVTGTSDCQWANTSSSTSNLSGAARGSPFFPTGTSFRAASTSGAIRAQHLTGNWNIGTKDFTIDFLCYITTSATPTALDMRGSGGPALLPLLGWDNSTGKFYYFTNGSTRISAGAWSINTPYLVTYNRTASTGTLFVNGTSVGTWADSSNYITTTVIWPIGTIGPPGPSLDYMDEVRITIGVARNPSTYFNTTTQPLLQRFPDH